jgi:hypothetical protein
MAATATPQGKSDLERIQEFLNLSLNHPTVHDAAYSHLEPAEIGRESRTLRLFTVEGKQILHVDIPSHHPLLSNKAFLDPARAFLNLALKLRPKRIEVGNGCICLLDAQGICMQKEELKLWERNPRNVDDLIFRRVSLWHLDIDWLLASKENIEFVNVQKPTLIPSCLLQ